MDNNSIEKEKQVSNKMKIPDSVIESLARAFLPDIIVSIKNQLIDDVYEIGRVSKLFV